tara:strand:+ start:52 stop:396 length:345 start_codon:yes stop_codon:yes gene_type:complete
MSTIFKFPQPQIVTVSVPTSFDNNDVLEVSFTEKEWGLVLNGNFAVRNIKEIIDDTEYTWSVLFNDNLYPKNNLVVVINNPNHIMSYSEMFMGNINDDDVSIKYERDILVETIN